MLCIGVVKICCALVDCSVEREGMMLGFRDFNNKKKRKGCLCFRRILSVTIVDDEIKIFEGKEIFMIVLELYSSSVWGFNEALATSE